MSDYPLGVRVVGVPVEVEAVLSLLHTAAADAGVRLQIDRHFYMDRSWDPEQSWDRESVRLFMASMRLSAEIVLSTRAVGAEEATA